MLGLVIWGVSRRRGSTVLRARWCLVRCALLLVLVPLLLADEHDILTNAANRWLRHQQHLSAVLPVVMAALTCNGHAIMFYSCGFFLFSSPILNGRRLDVYDTSMHHVALVQIECRSEMCCTRLAENAGRKNSPSVHHRTTLSGYIFATKAYTNRVVDIWNSLPVYLQQSFLWSPYVIGRPYIFSSCSFFPSIFLFFLA